MAELVSVAPSTTRPGLIEKVYIGSRTGALIKTYFRVDSNGVEHMEDPFSDIEESEDEDASSTSDMTEPVKLKPNQYIGRRTGALIEINARKDSDGFELIEDYFPESIRESDCSTPFTQDLTNDSKLSSCGTITEREKSQEEGIANKENMVVEPEEKSHLSSLSKENNDNVTPQVNEIEISQNLTGTAVKYSEASAGSSPQFFGSKKRLFSETANITREKISKIDGDIDIVGLSDDEQEINAQYQQKANDNRKEKKVCMTAKDDTIIVDVVGGDTPCFNDKSKGSKVKGGAEEDIGDRSFETSVTEDTLVDVVDYTPVPNDKSKRSKVKGGKEKDEEATDGKTKDDNLIEDEDDSTFVTLGNKSKMSTLKSIAHDNLLPDNEESYQMDESAVLEGTKHKLMSPEFGSVSTHASRVSRTENDRTEDMAKPKGRQTRNSKKSFSKKSFKEHEEDESQDGHVEESVEHEADDGTFVKPVVKKATRTKKSTSNNLSMKEKQTQKLISSDQTNEDSNVSLVEKTKQKSKKSISKKSMKEAQLEEDNNEEVSSETKASHETEGQKTAKKTATKKSTQKEQDKEHTANTFQEREERVGTRRVTRSISNLASITSTSLEEKTFNKKNVKKTKAPGRRSTRSKTNKSMVSDKDSISGESNSEKNESENKNASVVENEEFQGEDGRNTSFTLELEDDMPEALDTTGEDKSADTLEDPVSKRQSKDKTRMNESKSRSGTKKTKAPGRPSTRSKTNKSMASNKDSISGESNSEKNESENKNVSEVENEEFQGEDGRNTSFTLELEDDMPEALDTIGEDKSADTLEDPVSKRQSKDETRMNESKSRSGTKKTKAPERRSTRSKTNKSRASDKDSVSGESNSEKNESESKNMSEVENEEFQGEDGRNTSFTLELEDDMPGDAEYEVYDREALDTTGEDKSADTLEDPVSKRQSRNKTRMNDSKSRSGTKELQGTDSMDVDEQDDSCSCDADGDDEQESQEIAKRPYRKETKGRKVANKGAAWRATLNNQGDSSHDDDNQDQDVDKSQDGNENNSEFDLTNTKKSSKEKSGKRRSSSSSAPDSDKSGSDGKKTRKRKRKSPKVSMTRRSRRKPHRNDTKETSGNDITDQEGTADESDYGAKDDDIKETDDKTINKSSRKRTNQTRIESMQVAQSSTPVVLSGSPYVLPPGSVKSILKSSIPRTLSADAKKRRVSIATNKKGSSSSVDAGDDNDEGGKSKSPRRRRKSSVSFAPTPSFHIAPDDFSTLEESPGELEKLSFVTNYSGFTSGDNTFTPGVLSAASICSSVSSLGSVSDPLSDTSGVSEYQEITINNSKREKIAEEEEQDDSGVRRSKRTKVPPLEYWKNERIKYERRKSGWFVSGIEKVPTPAVPKRKTKKPRKEKKKAIRRVSSEEEADDVYDEPGDMDEVTYTSIPIVNPDNGEQVELDLLRTPEMLNFINTSGKPAEPEDPVIMEKHMSHNLFGAGHIVLRSGAEKGKQHVRNDTMYFYVLKGQVEVTIHQTTVLLRTGSTFFVPTGNCYNIKNVRDSDARLLFVQIKG